MDVSSLHPPFLILELNSFNSIGSQLFFTLSSIYHPPLNDRYPLHKNFISNEFCGEKLGVIPKPRRERSVAEARIVKFFSFRASCWGEGCGERDGDRTCLAIRELFAAGGRVSSVQSGVYLNSEHTGLKYARKKKDSHTFEADQASFKGSRVSPPDSPCYHFAFRPSQRTSCRAFNMPEDSGYLSLLSNISI